MNAPNDAVLLPEMPAVAGLCFRHVRSEQDAEGLYLIHAGRVARDQVDLQSISEGLPSREEIGASLAKLVAAQQQHRRLVAEVNGRMVGYSLVESWFEQDGRWVYLTVGWVLPEWRERGIGTAMLRWGERTARQMAAADHPGEPFEFASNASSTETDTAALLRHEGYYVGYTVLEMALDTAALPPPQPLPAGIEVRPARPEHYPLIADSMIASYRDEYPGHRFQETSDAADSIAGLEEPVHDPTLWQIAWDGQQVVGLVIPKIEKGRASLYDVSVRPAWRRRGLARALLTRALHAVRQRGVEAIRVNTVAEFPTCAKDLYRSVGFRLVKEFPRYRKSP